MINYWKNKGIFRDENDEFHFVIITQSLADGPQVLHYINDKDVCLKPMSYYGNPPTLIKLLEFLTANGYSKDDFKNPLGRTKRILSVIKSINEINKPKVKTIAD